MERGTTRLLSLILLLFIFLTLAFQGAVLWYTQLNNRSQLNSLKVYQAHNQNGAALHVSVNRLIASDTRIIFANPRIFRQNLSDAEALKLSYLTDRVQHAEKKCREGWRPNDPNFFPRLRLYYDGNRNMVFCQTAKAGSTFWRRILTFLTRRKKLAKYGVKDPFRIEKNSVHSGTWGPRLEEMWYGYKTRVETKHTLRFLFTRNPYSRLWSVFLDKFYLLGEWEGKGRSEFWCDDFDSFQQFLDNALSSTDHHVRPVSETCDPCTFQPHVIGHAETFGTDAAFILNQTLYGYLLYSYSNEYRVEIEINSTIVNNFKILSLVKQERKVCLDEKALCERLWRVFQYQGYISSDTSFPTGKIDYSEKAMVPIFLQAARNSSMTRQKSQQQKHRSIAEAYKNIPQTLIRQIQIRYEGDFEMFGYDSTPPS